MDASMWDHIPEGITSEAAKPKRPTADAPTQQPMRADIKPAQQRKPSADQKRVRRQMARQASLPAGYEDQPMTVIDAEGEEWTRVTEESEHLWVHSYVPTAEIGRNPMMLSLDQIQQQYGLAPKNASTATTKESTMNQPTEAHLIQRLASASTLVEQAAISAQIDSLRAARRESLATEGALDWDGMGALPPTREQQAASHFASMPAAGGGTRTQTTSSSDWMDDLSPSHTADPVLSATARAEATQWFSNVWGPVKQDAHELSVQADNAAVRSSHQFGMQASAAKSVFLDQVKHLASREGITLTALETTVDTYVSDGKTTTPVGVSPSSTNGPTESMDEWGIGSDLNGTEDPKSTNSADAPSLAEGDTPEGASGESLDNPNFGQTGQDKSKFTPGNTDDLMKTQGSVPMDKCEKCGATWTGGLDEHKGICPQCSHKNASKTAARDCSWTRVSEPGEDDGLTWYECSTHGKTEMGGEDSDPDFPCEGWLDENAAENPYTGSRNRSKTALTNGDKATCFCGKPIEMFDYSWYHLSADGPIDWAAHGPETYPGKSASRKKTSMHLTDVGIDSNGKDGVGTDPDGVRVRFRLSEKELADLKAVLYSDLAMNFSGVDVEAADLVMGPREAASADSRISAHMASQFGGYGMGIQRLADDSTTADGLSSARAGDAPSLTEGGEVEGDHSESPTQENGEGAVDMSHATPHDNLHDVNWGSTATLHTADGPTNSWTCECGTTVERWRGESDVSCPNCNAQYNASGQRLRDDWRGNASNYDSEVGDMEGYENQYAHDASLKPSHTLASIGASFEGKPVSQNTAVFAKALTAAKFIDDSVGGVSIRRVATMLASTPEVPANVKQALMEHLRPTAAKTADARPLYEIADDIKRNWPNVYFGAVPYLDALGQLSTMQDRYYEDDAATIVHYLLSNMGSKFKGPEAARLKAELKALVARKSSKTAGMTCSVCGDAIASDPNGEDPSTYHHDNGEKHDHEAKPGSDSDSKESAKTAGEVPEAFKQNWDKGDGDDADAKDESGEGKPWEKEGQRAPFARSAAEEQRHSKTCPKCKATLGSVVQYGDTLSAKCDSCGWSGTKTKKSAARDTGTCGECGRGTSYDRDARKWTHDNEGPDTQHKVTKASRLASFSARVQAGISRVAQAAPSGVDWGKPYAGGSESYQTPDGPVWMFRKGQTVRFYNESGKQVGPEQSNVAPAAAYAQSQGWESPGLAGLGPIGGSKTADGKGNSFSISDAKNEDGEWIMSPEEIRAEMAYDPSEDYDPYDDDNYREGSRKTATQFHCHHCGNDISWKEDPTGQRGQAWTDQPGETNSLNDMGFQCGLSPSGKHEPTAEWHEGSRKTAQDVPAGYEGGTCRTCGRDIIGQGGKWIHDPRSAGSPQPDGSVAGDAHGVVPKEGSRRTASEWSDSNPGKTRCEKTEQVGGFGEGGDGQKYQRCSKEKGHEPKDAHEFNGPSVPAPTASRKRADKEWGTASSGLTPGDRIRIEVRPISLDGTVGTERTYEGTFKGQDSFGFRFDDGDGTPGGSVGREFAESEIVEVHKISSRKTAGGDWKAQVAGVGEHVWSENSLRYDTPEEAKAYIADLSMKWFGFDLGRVVPSSTPNREPVDLADPQITHNFR